MSPSTFKSDVIVVTVLIETLLPIAALITRSPPLVSMVVVPPTPSLIPSMYAFSNAWSSLPMYAPLSTSGIIPVSTIISSPNVALPETPIPPATTRAPVVLLVDGVVSSNFRTPVIVPVFLSLTSLLNVTGPSNWDNTVPDLPPSTLNLSLINTSSNTTLNLPTSCPVTVGDGISNVLSCPVAELDFLLPIKKSPSLFIPV